MSLDLVVRYLHFLSLFVLVSCLFAQFILLAPKLKRSQIQLLGKLDAAYGVASIVAVLAGLSLWFWLGKGADFYTDNPIFLTKISLAGVLGLLSIYPTIYFIKHRKGDLNEEIEVSKAVRVLVRLELVCVVAIPLLAVLMARGLGL